MKWFQKVMGGKPTTHYAADGGGDPVDPVKAAEHTERSAIPDEMDVETTPEPSPKTGPRNPASRPLTRTVASPIPAMLAESMGLAEEPDAPQSPPPNFVGPSGPRLPVGAPRSK